MFTNENLDNYWAVWYSKDNKERNRLLQSPLTHLAEAAEVENPGDEKSEVKPQNREEKEEERSGSEEPGIKERRMFPLGTSDDPIYIAPQYDGGRVSNSSQESHFSTR